MPSIWWPRQMPKVGTPLSMMSRMTGTAYSPVAAGSPGPFERKTPSGFSAMMSSAEVFAVTTVTLQPLPANATETHVSLFDGSNCGIALKDKPVFSVQYHPEASPGPRDSHYLFERFVEIMRQQKKRP